MPYSFRKARQEDAQALSTLALKSKTHWNYDRDFIENCKGDLTVTPSFIKANSVFIAEENGVLAGFYGLVEFPEPELYFFFIEINLIGKGLGRELWDHLVECAQQKGWESFKIESDPNAEVFYKHLGAIREGETVSSVNPQRKLPLLRYYLTSK